MNGLFSFIFPNLSTHRIPFNSTSGAIPSFFPYEQTIAASAVFFCRYTVKVQNEPRFLRLLFATLLALLRTNIHVDYRILIIAQFCTYAVLLYRLSDRFKWTKADKYQQQIYSTSITILITSCFIRLVYTLSHQDPFKLWITLHPYCMIIPGFQFALSKICDSIKYLIPVDEVLSAYNTLLLFVPASTLHVQMKHLLYVTFNIQVGMGFLGKYS